MAAEPGGTRDGGPAVAADRPDATALLVELRAGRVDPAGLLDRHLARLRVVEPTLNAAVELLTDEARAAAATGPTGPLAGLPVSVKETFGLAGRTVTAGSRSMAPVSNTADAAAVSRLRAAGALVLARGNVPEFAMAAETENPRYGRSANPLAPERTCGGSSGGDAALVAAGAVAAGLGSDILGSIRIPAAFCGVVGFKPSAGAVPKEGMWPDIGGLFADTWLGVGPLTRSVRDARLVYSVLAHRPPPPPAPPAGLRLILPQRFPWRARNPLIEAALTTAADLLRAGGLREERRELGDVQDWYRTMMGVLAYELMPELQRRLRSPGGRRFSTTGESLRRLAGRGRLYSGLYRLLVVAPLVRYRRPATAERGIARLEAARRDVYALLGTDGLLLLPTIGTLAPRHGEMNRLSFRPGVNPLLTPTSLCNYLDLPAITVPARRYRDPATGLMPGIMLAAAPGAEGPLLDAAGALEAGMSSRG
jgi:Asp-tRNA(Asn)/Glu-tRNA(Gln) amidotransferase A subunit family amidase